MTTLCIRGIGPSLDNVVSCFASLPGFRNCRVRELQSTREDQKKLGLGCVAFVEFSDAAAARGALDLRQGVILNGRPMSIELANSQKRPRPDAAPVHDYTREDPTAVRSHDEVLRTLLRFNCAYVQSPNCACV